MSRTRPEQLLYVLTQGARKCSGDKDTVCGTFPCYAYLENLLLMKRFLENLLLRRRFMTNLLLRRKQNEDPNCGINFSFCASPCFLCLMVLKEIHLGRKEYEDATVRLTSPFARFTIFSMSYGSKRIHRGNSNCGTYFSFRAAKCVSFTS